MHITAKANFHGHELNDIPVLNPGDWFGKTWLLEIGGSYTPIFLVVEADNMSDAIDELAENEKYGHHIVVDEKDLGDYDIQECHYSDSGQVLDLDWLMIHGDEGTNCPFLCRYFGKRLPGEGVDPVNLAEFDWDES